MERQLALRAVFLAVAVDEHGLAVVVAGQAVVVQLAGLVRPPTRVDEQLDPDPHLPLDAPVEPVQVGAELPHHLGRKVTASLTAFRPGRQVAPDQREVIGQAVHRLGRPGQPEEAAALEDAAGGDDDLATLVRADLAQALLAAGAGEEELDVLTAQAGRVVPPVGARPQAL